MNYGEVETMWQVDVGYACFGILLHNHVVVEAAPIGKWMIGKTFSSVSAWVRKKNGTLQHVHLAQLERPA